MTWRLLPGAVLVLLLPSFAAAECAWVLWVQTSEYTEARGTRTGEWDIVQAVRAQAACEDIIKVKTKDAPAHLGPGYATVKDVPTPGGQMRQLLFRYLCVPDTIDPRGSKGR